MRIAFIAAGALPIPATKGGATETMLTHLLQQNEQHKQFKATVFCCYDSEAEALTQNYSETTWYFYRTKSKLSQLRGIFWRGLRKLTGGKSYLRTDFIKWCISKITRHAFDVVIVEGNHFQVLQLKKALDVPIVLHMHIDGLTKQTDNGKNILSSCNGVIAISEYCKKRIAELDKTQTDKIHVLKNTVDIEHFRADHRTEFREAFRKAHNIGHNQTLFVYCGRLSPQKGVKELLDAFISLKNNNYYLMIIGGSFFKGAPKNDFVIDLEKQAEPYSDRIFFTGYISQDELPNYYAAADISIMPSKWEAAGNVIIEALACGLPVIASNVGGIPEYADQSACTLVECDAHFTQNLASAMHLIATDQNILKEQKKNACSVAEKYHISNYYQNFCSVIGSIME